MSIDEMFTKKQQNVFAELNKEDWFIAILHGAVRSGKTFIDNFVFLNELRRVSRIAAKEGVKNPQYILAGYTMGNINDNIINELANTFGIEPKFDRYGSFTLFGVKVIQTTTGNKAGVGRIRGMTAYGAYINEGSLAQREVFEEIKTRCSGTGARIICDTNPDHPEHWLKKEYIDKASDPKSEIKEFRFILDDNTFLSDRYIRNLKASTSTGMFYDRSILGLWVTADGAIYSDFDAKRDAVPVGTYDWWRADEIIYGCDWGYGHYGSITMLGRFNQTWVLLKETSETGREIDWWVDTMKSYISKYGDGPVYCDSARVEHVDRFAREGINAINADKSVLAGIEMVGGIIKQGLFRVVRDECPKFMAEVYAYSWNDRTGLPVKENDDCLDSLRYAIYTHQHKPVEWVTSQPLIY